MERKLATIAKITDIRQITGADSIDVATVRGWNVCVKRNEFHVGEMCIYCEVDSFLPIRPEFEFLRKSSYKVMADGTEGFRIRTVKLRGQISQGICFPLSILGKVDSQISTTTTLLIQPTLDNDGKPTYSIYDELLCHWSIVYENMDVTSILGIVKYEAPIPAELTGKVKGMFPAWLNATDEERIQNIGFVLTKYADVVFYSSEKLDGTSGTYYLKDGEFGVCSRGLDLLESETNTFWRVARKLNLELKMRSVGKNISLQGEVIGEGIQGNKYALRGQTVRFFNAYDINAGKYYDFWDFMNLIADLGLETVPILSSEVKLLPTVDEVVAAADGQSTLNPKMIREGIVYRPLTEMFDADIPHSGRLSFKARSNAFILKYGD